MNKRMLEEIKKKYNCAQVDVGAFKQVRIEGAKVVIEAYDVEGVGRVSLAQMKGFLGLWKMQSMIVNPLDKDMPIFYYHRHDRKGNDICKMELINTQVHPVELDSIMAVLEKYMSIPDAEEKEEWYKDMRLPGCTLKRVKKDSATEVDKLVSDYFGAYMDLLENAPECERPKKKKKAAEFVDGLVENSGIALTQLFRAYYDKKVAAKLCKDILFGML